MKTLGALLVAAAVVGVAQCGLQVVTEGGRIQGKAETSINGKPFNSFYGIPYARPPIGADRFKDPVKPFTWHRLADATRMPQPCLHVPFFTALQGIYIKAEDLVGSEHCLFLNVFTSEIGPNPERVKLPVMVWLHGGGFFAGGADEYPPHTFLDHEVVMVVVQYRLGIFGFLSTEDSVMPGNLGLKDQVMALEWVQRNIYLFGGDKTRVTIFGESAGGAASHFHMLLPKSKGLFSQVILQSGTALAPWALNNRHREQAETLGNRFGCDDVQNSTSLLSCLQNIDGRELSATIQDTFKWILLPMINTPRVDGDFLPDLPANLVANKEYHEVNLLAGVTKDDGAIVIRVIYSDREVATSLEENFDEIGPISLNIHNENDSLTLAKTIYKHYMSDVICDEAHSEQLQQVFNDMFFNFDHDEVTSHHAAHFPSRQTFRYQFNYRGETGLCDGFNTDIGKDWVIHADDLIYLFAGGKLLNAALPNGLTNPEDVRVRKMMVKMWVNFATSGNPTPDDSLGFKWEPSTTDNLHYLSITSSPRMEPDNRKEGRKFFASLPLLNSKILYPGKQEEQQQQQSTRVGKEEL